jgi:hypothetical protein
LQKITDKPLNIVSDSAYVVGLFPAIETDLISTTHKVMKTLLSTLQHLIQTHTYPLYVTHIRAHSNLPGPLVRENSGTDKISCTVFSSPEKEHQHFHTNANRLHVHYKIPLHTAHDIIKFCPVCTPLHCRSHPSGANPLDLHTNELWQMDVTHITFFPQQPYLHAVFDTYSKFIWAVLQHNKNVRAIIASLLQCFTVMGVYSKLKTNSGPTYTGL